MTGPHATVAKDGGTWRWECRHCGCSDVRWRHREAIHEVRVHLARHQSFGFRSERWKKARP